MTDGSADETVAEWSDSDRETFERQLRKSDLLDDIDGGRQAEDVQPLEILLTDYRTASEDAKYRDSLITQTFYLSFVVGGLLLNGMITILFQSQVTPPTRFLSLAIITLIGVISFAILLVFVESFQKSRNSAWARRSEIESYVRSKYPGTLGTNESIARVLSFADPDEGDAESHGTLGFSLARYRSKFADQSASSIMSLFLLGAIVVSVLGFVISIIMFSCNVGWCPL